MDLGLLREGILKILRRLTLRTYSVSLANICPGGWSQTGLVFETGVFENLSPRLKDIQKLLDVWEELMDSVHLASALTLLIIAHINVRSASLS